MKFLDLSSKNISNKLIDTLPTLISKLKNIPESILEPSGGFLWDGFRQNAPKAWRKDNIYKK